MSTAAAFSCFYFQFSCCFFRLEIFSFTILFQCFLRTRLCLEYKLCRLLLRTLDNRTARVSSRGLRGYSRATSYTVFSPVGNGARPSSRTSNQSWPGILTRHFGRRPLGSATSLPAMMNLGLGQKVEGSLEKEHESGSENNKEQKDRMEGEG